MRAVHPIIGYGGPGLFIDLLVELRTDLRAAKQFEPAGPGAVSLFVPQECN